MLPLMQFLPATKVANIQRGLRNASEEYEIRSEIIEALESPIFRGGVSFSMRRFQQRSALIEFVRYLLRTLTTEELDRGNVEPLAWRDIANSSSGSPELSLRHSLIYLGHPDYFFPIVAETDKKRIVAALFPAETGRPASGDLDVDLAALREWMSPSPPGRCRSSTSPRCPTSGVTLMRRPKRRAVRPTPWSRLSRTGLSIPRRSCVESSTAGSTKSIVLQGAPGASKTWLARRLAYALIGFEDEESVRAVQFHPSTSYEDFVRGWRPNGDGTLTLVDGPVLQHAELARQDPGIAHVIIIEEFSRGIPARALGEMLTLLERTKRSEREALELTYNREDED